jgi:CheY-like chemotaxis protein
MPNRNEVGILLVEDNPRDAELTIRELKQRSLADNLVWVRDGAEALDFVLGSASLTSPKTAHRPKVILLDLKLPKVDGLSVLRQLKEHQTARTIPVVVLTSSQEEQDLVWSYELGVNSYVVKPVAFDQFSQAVAGLGRYWMSLNQLAGKFHQQADPTPVL